MNQLSKTSIIITGIAVAAIGWNIYRLHTKQITTSSSNVSQTTNTTDAWPSYEVDRKTISDSNQYYSIETIYPITKSVAINDTIASFIEDQILQFKEDTAWVTDPSIDSASKGALSLSIAYTEQKSTRAHTYIFTITTYTGGAHGLQVTKTFTFDQHGSPITLSELLSSVKTGLPKIAAFVTKELEKKGISDAQWIADGAGPTLENYQNFILDEQGMTIIFDPYQVAPYAEGTQKILVPFAVLTEVVRPVFID